ncbi:MAG: hypothetical protein WAN81_20290, partial [Candidatus Binataceae bacterium]
MSDSSAAGADGRGGGTLARVGRGGALCLSGGLGCTAGAAFSEDDAAAVCAGGFAVAAAAGAAA